MYFAVLDTKLPSDGLIQVILSCCNLPLENPHIRLLCFSFDYGQPLSQGQKESRLSQLRVENAHFRTETPRSCSSMSYLLYSGSAEALAALWLEWHQQPALVLGCCIVHAAGEVGEYKYRISGTQSTSHSHIHNLLLLFPSPLIMFPAQKWWRRWRTWPRWMWSWPWRRGTSCQWPTRTWSGHGGQAGGSSPPSSRRRSTRGARTSWGWSGLTGTRWESWSGNGNQARVREKMQGRVC